MNEAQLSEQQKQVETGETTTQTVPIVEQTTNESTQESNVTAANATANADQQAVSSAPKLTIEQQQAEELRLKYPIPPGGKPGGKGAFIQKMLHRVIIHSFTIIFIIIIIIYLKLIKEQKIF